MTFDGTSGMLKQMTRLDTGVSSTLTQSLMYYVSHAGNNSEGIFQASGAYAFRPKSSEAVPISTTTKNSVYQVLYIIPYMYVFIQDICLASFVSCNLVTIALILRMHVLPYYRVRLYKKYVRFMDRGPVR